MNDTLIDNLRYVLQNMRLKKGDMAKVQSDIVAQAISEIMRLNAKIDDDAKYQAMRNEMNEGKSHHTFGYEP